MKKYIIYGVVAIILVASFYIWNTEKTYSPAKNEQASSTSLTTSTTTTQTPPTNTTTKPPVSIPTQEAGTFTAVQVKKHNSETSCYSTINRNVYDLTEWINKHPGGKLAILAICGRDGSTAFNLKHGGKEKQESTLTKFKIGVIVE